MKKVVPIVLVALAVVAVVGIKNSKKEKQETTGCEGGVCTLPFPEGKMMPEAAQGEPGATESQALPKLLDLGADKCVPCKAMAPILDEMKETFAGQLKVEFIDVWENEGVSEKYGVRMIPTQIFLAADGRELFRHEGFFAREDMLAKWKELGYNFTESK